MDTIQEHDFMEQLSTLESAEDFLEFFEVDYDQDIVQRKHIPLLRLFQKLLSCKTVADYGSYQKSLNLAYKQILLGNEPMLNGGGCAGCKADCADAH